MVHAVRIKDGKATYCNRYVETSKLKQERQAGGPVFAAVSRWQVGFSSCLVISICLPAIVHGRSNIGTTLLSNPSCLV